MPKKVPAARLAQGGAPECWHAVVGLPGHFHPLVAVPLDQPGLVTSEQLHAFIAAHDEKVAAAAAGWETFRHGQIEKGLADIGEFTPSPCPVELVELNDTLVEEHANAAREQRAASARAAASARRNGDGDAPNVQAEIAAAGGGE